MKEGIDFKYGARHLKRSVERFLVFPLSNLVATGQIGLGDLVWVDLDEYTKKLIFSKTSGATLIQDLPTHQSNLETPKALYGGMGISISQAAPTIPDKVATAAAVSTEPTRWGTFSQPPQYI